MPAESPAQPPPAQSSAEPPTGTRTRILDTAAALLAGIGPAHVDQLTTRAVCDAAGVTAPTLYHHFGDKNGLVAAVVARTAEAFLAAKASAAPPDDPVEDLRRGWDTWVAFALEHPALFALAMASPRAGPGAKAAAYARLRAIVARAEAAGRLTVSAACAADTTWAAAQGMTTLLIERAYADAPIEDLATVSATLRGAVLAAVTTATVTAAAPARKRGGEDGAPPRRATRRG